MAGDGWGKAAIGVLALTGAILGSACASTAPSKLSPQQRTAIQSRSVILQSLPITHFSLISASSTFASALGGPFMVGMNEVRAQRAGDLIVERDHLVDPASVIASALLADLEKTYGMKATQVERLVSSTRPSAMPLTGADFVLSLEVPAWSTMYLPGRMSQYGVLLTARARIVDGVTAKTLREARCIIRPRNRPDAPTFTELLEDEGVRLRTEVDYATQACVEALKQSLLGE